MTAIVNKPKVEAIQKLIEDYCDANLDNMYKEIVLNLCEAASQNKDLKMSLGKNEIWAGSLIHVIAQLNLLYDHENSDRPHITFDSLCEFFQASKASITRKGNLIKKVCNNQIGQPKYSHSDIVDIDTFFERNKALRADNSSKKRFLEKELVIKTASEEESAEIDRFMAEQKRLENEKLQQKKARRLEINRMIAEKKKAKKREIDKKQLKLFDI